jgi:hypothetical protein
MGWQACHPVTHSVPFPWISRWPEGCNSKSISASRIASIPRPDDST